MLALALLAAVQSPITVENLEPGALLRHPVAIIRGRVGAGGLRVGLEGTQPTFVPAFQNRYSAVVELKPGRNFVVLRSGTNQIRLRLDYRPMQTPYVVRTIYALAADETPATQAPGTIPKGDVAAKMDTAMKLMQAVTADAMAERGYGLRTFPLELDANGRVVVHYVKSPKTAEELRKMEGGDIWGHTYDLLSRQFGPSTNKWMVVANYSAFDPATKRMQAHFALGGGQLAMFGGGTVGYWPASLAEVPRVFANRSVIDHNTTFEDSAYRRTVWANVSTAYGAMLHELGHTWGLPHSPSRFSVMSRGFDFFNRRLMAYEAPLPGKTEELPVNLAEAMQWEPFHAARLRWSPWFTAENPPAQDGKAPVIRVDGDAAIFESASGLRVVGAERDELIPEWTEFATAAPKTHRMDLKKIREAFAGKPFTLYAVDSLGQESRLEVKP